jgi:dTDP-glucose pyrophosphorylase
MQSIDYKDARLIFVLRKEHAQNFALDARLRQLFGSSIDLILLDEPTEGALCSCLRAKSLIDNDNHLVIFTPDCYFEPRFSLSRMKEQWDGAVSVFSSCNDAHSYVQLDDNGLVQYAAEKQVISNDAVGGLYYFKRGHTFVRFAQEQIKRSMRTKGEFYICPVFNLLIEAGMKIGIDRNAKHVVLGTPEDLRRHVTEE